MDYVDFLLSFKDLINVARFLSYVHLMVVIVLEFVTKSFIQYD